jgi:hypothetical protein
MAHLESFLRTDPDLDYQYYDLTKDADHVLTEITRPTKGTFDRVKYWPPHSLAHLKGRKRRIEEVVRRSKNIFNTTSLKNQNIEILNDAVNSKSVCKVCGSPFDG